MRPVVAGSLSSRRPGGATSRIVLEARGSMPPHSQEASWSSCHLSLLAWPHFSCPGPGPSAGGVKKEGFISMEAEQCPHESG